MASSALGGPSPPFLPFTTTSSTLRPFSAARLSSFRFPNIRVSCSGSTDPGTAESVSSLIELQFIGPEPESNGSADKDTVTVVSGEKLLRTVMNEQKLELYDLYGKFMNCGGGGSCGTCIVEIIEGSELLNERTDAEYRYLKKKPANWRLACQTIVGNKSNSGKVVVQRLPQKKK